MPSVRLYRLPGAATPNAQLPKLDTYGFADDFARADGPLGQTLDGKPWTQSSGNGSQWAIDAGRAHLVSVNAPDNRSLALVDAHTADGTLTAIAGTNLAGPGFVVRALNYHSHLRINAPSGRLTLTRLVTPGTATTIAVAEAASPINAGDTIDIILDGPSITLRRNGVVVLTADEPYNATMTRHGLFGLMTQPAARFAGVRFTR